MSSDANERIDRILADIKSIRVQGAENVARAGIKAFLLDPTKANAKRIVSVRATEPLLQNAIKVLLKSKNKRASAKAFLEELSNSHDTISKFGSTLVKGNINIYTHCHSSTVIDILRMAKSKKRRFIVYTTEVEPLLQGRMTAKDLDKEGVKVIIAPDMAAEQILRKCDLLLFGVDAFTNTAVCNKIGTETLCRLAKHYRIPRYACGVSMKATWKVKIEQRKGREVWDERKKNIKVVYPAFDKVNYKLISGIISEFGILKPKSFSKKAKRKLKKMSSI
jgi:translation initiation factor 2B subunit (eIF-2B alpha/beta/delta family)